MSEEWKAKVNEQLEDHHRRISDLSVASEKHTQALNENTRLTQQIADNTGELVELFKGAKSVRRFFMWSAPYLAAIATVYATVKYWILRII
jgi:hypothetical protein